MAIYSTDTIYLAMPYYCILKQGVQEIQESCRKGSIEHKDWDIKWAKIGKKCIFILTRTESLKSKNGKERNAIDNGSLKAKVKR